MDGKTLSGMLGYTGMERAARKLALNDKMAKAEEIAIMSESEVCDLIVKNYFVVMNDDENVLLIPKDKAKEFNDMAVFLSR